MKTGIRMETWEIAGRCQQRTSDRYAGAKRPINDEVDKQRVPESMVQLFKEVSARAYALLPNGAGKLIVRVDYELPKS